jgi:hypothetical protein
MRVLDPIVDFGELNFLIEVVGNLPSKRPGYFGPIPVGLKGLGQVGLAVDRCDDDKWVEL